jgi:hypothetical protein
MVGLIEILLTFGRICPYDESIMSEAEASTEIS